MTTEGAIASGRAAIEHVLATKTDAIGAMTLRDGSRVSFLAGVPGDPRRDFKGGYGLSHIVAKRNAQGIDGQDVARRIPEILVRGKSLSRTDGRQVFSHDSHIVVLDRELPSTGEKTDGTLWVVTGYKPDKTPRRLRG